MNALDSAWRTVDPHLAQACARLEELTGLRWTPLTLVLGLGLVLIILLFCFLLWRHRTRHSRLLKKVLQMAEGEDWESIVRLAEPWQRMSPPPIALLEQAARAYAAMGNAKTAERLYKRIVMAPKPDDGSIHARCQEALDGMEAKKLYRAGLMAIRSKRFSAAARSFQKLGKNDLYPNAPLLLTICFLRMNEPDLARRQLRKISLSKLDMTGLYQLAVAFHEAKQLAEARKLYEKLMLSDMSFEDVSARLEAIKEEEKKEREASANQSRTGGAPKDLLDLIRSQIPPRYELKAKLGMGGMGVVVRATDLEHRNDVAIKVLSPILAENVELRTRFTQEASALVKLDHPNIIRILEVGGDLLPYYVMEYLEGKSVADFLDERILPMKDNIYIALQVSAALKYAHGQNVVHRDVKPENILVDDRGIVRLVDFGLAKFLGATAVTGSDNIVGTELYMSPEQITTGKVDARSDIYSLGVTLYHMCTGEPPFIESPMYEHVSAIPNDPSQINPDITPKLRELILRCLEKQVDDRYPNCAVLEGELKVAMREASERERSVQSVIFS